jgi:hypothetical protein
MNDSSDHQQARRGPAAFLLWGWAMLLVVLLSAAPTGGPPRTRLLGSAFDPATITVVLSPKQPRYDASTSSAHRRKLPEKIGGGSAHIVRVAGWHAPAPLAQARPFRLDMRSQPRAGQRGFTRAHAPRAPPLA